MIGWKVSTSRLGVKGLLGTLLSLLAGMVVCGDHVPDTCGDYFYFPVLPTCDIFLEAVPCFNYTSTIRVTMTTPSGELIKNFGVNYGSKKEFSIGDTLHGKKHIEGLVVKSTYDISIYLHKDSGDSLIVYPLDTYAREYEIGNMSSPATHNDNDIKKRSARKSSPTRTSDMSSTTDDMMLYFFSPFNGTVITVTSFNALDTSPANSASKTIVTSDAFEIHRHVVSSTSRHIMTSRDLFAVVLVQPKSGFLHENATLCKEVPMILFDFLPPGSILGTQFYLAFPGQTAFTLYFHGKQNTSVDILTEKSNLEISLGDSGSTWKYVTMTSSAWISSSTPVGIYVTLTVCSNSSIILPSSYISSALTSFSSSSSSSSSSSHPISSQKSPSSSDSQQSSSSSLKSNNTCAENGFFLPSLEHFFTCTSNKSRDTCLCTCPSVFQREVPKNTQDPNRDNSSESTYFPLLVGELYDISTSISPAIGSNRTYDVVMTTNNSFMVYRHDFNNTNFMPAGSSLMQIYSPCFSNAHSSLFKSCPDISDNNYNRMMNSNNENNDYDNVNNNNNKDNVKDFQSDDTDKDYSSMLSSSLLSALSSSSSSTPECSCDNIFDVSSTVSLARQWNNRSDSNLGGGGKSGSVGKVSTRRYRIGEFVWEEEDEDQTRPMIAVVVSLSVAIFAAAVLILGYMLDEWISQRRLVRNTKIRPFVS